MNIIKDYKESAVENSILWTKSSFLDTSKNIQDNMQDNIQDKYNENCEHAIINTKKESVNHPDHYNFGKYEVIDVIEDWELDFSLGNAVKYIARAGKKDKNKAIEDLEKALWYINHKIKKMKKEEM